MAAAGANATATATIDVGGVTAINLTAAGSGYITPGGIKKFVDPLPGLCNPERPWQLSRADRQVHPARGAGRPRRTHGIEADEYEIGLVQYRTSFSSSLRPARRPVGTLVRGYVQLETPANAAISQHFPLTNELLNGTKSRSEQRRRHAVAGVTPPQWLGPIIAATKDKPVRIIFRNLLPTGCRRRPVPAHRQHPDGLRDGPDIAMWDPAGSGHVSRTRPATRSAPKTRSQTTCFKDNRATLHLHGGITPWISDGTPHQWITPANETTPWPQGVSVSNVPDMAAAGCDGTTDGCMTFYYTNQQSARLMFYHDHAWGITRLNVYAGEAAGYLISDDTEKALIASGTIPGAADTDPADHPGPDLRAAGHAAVQRGRQRTAWDRAMTVQRQLRAGPDLGREPLGRLRQLLVPPRLHAGAEPRRPGRHERLRALDVRAVVLASGCEPRSSGRSPTRTTARTRRDRRHTGHADDWQPWQCPATWTTRPPGSTTPTRSASRQLIPGTPNISTGMEQFNDTPIVNGVAYPTITLEPKTYRFRVLNAANDRFFNFQWYVGDPTTASTGLNNLGRSHRRDRGRAEPRSSWLAAQTDPVVFPTPVQRPGRTCRPDWIQIGTEGGFLPAPVVVDGQQPTTWITDPTRFDVGNVDQHSLLLAPAERADVIVDFSQFAGKTLILYNDAPAAFPARVPSYDYYTGAPDLSPNGAPAILPGYGPNTRTIMQVKIAAQPLPRRST